MSDPAKLRMLADQRQASDEFGYDGMVIGVLRQAADEIERLRAELFERKDDISYAIELHAEQTNKLRAELHAARAVVEAARKLADHPEVEEAWAYDVYQALAAYDQAVKGAT